MPRAKRQPELLQDAWDILVKVAAQGATMTYGQLAAKLARPGYQPIAQSMQGLLNPIMDYCDGHKLPRLNDLVVNQKTQRPSYAGPDYDHVASQKKVYACNWATVAIDDGAFGSR